MSDPHASLFDHAGDAVLALVGLTVGSLVYSVLTLAPVGVVVWALDLGPRVLALAAVPWLVLAAAAVVSPNGTGRVFAGSVGPALVCLAAAWWLASP